MRFSLSKTRQLFLFSLCGKRETDFRTFQREKDAKGLPPIWIPAADFSAGARQMSAALRGRKDFQLARTGSHGDCTPRLGTGVNTSSDSRPARTRGTARPRSAARLFRRQAARQMVLKQVSKGSALWRPFLFGKSENLFFFSHAGKEKQLSGPGQAKAPRQKSPALGRQQGRPPPSGGKAAQPRLVGNVPQYPYPATYSEHWLNHVPRVYFISIFKPKVHIITKINRYAMCLVDTRRGRCYSG